MLNFPLNGIKLKHQTLHITPTCWLWLSPGSARGWTSRWGDSAQSVFPETSRPADSTYSCYFSYQFYKYQLFRDVPGLRDGVVWYPAPAGVAPHVITGGEGGVPRPHHLGGGGQAGGAPADTDGASVSQVGHWQYFSKVNRITKYSMRMHFRRHSYFKLEIPVQFICTK